MIVRSGVALGKLLCTIEASGFLGKCVPKELESFKKSHSKVILSQDPLCDKLFRREMEQSAVRIMHLASGSRTV